MSLGQFGDNIPSATKKLNHLLGRQTVSIDIEIGEFKVYTFTDLDERQLLTIISLNGLNRNLLGNT